MRQNAATPSIGINANNIAGPLEEIQSSIAGTYFVFDLH